MIYNIKRKINKETISDIFRLNILLTCFVVVCSLIFLVLSEKSRVIIVMATKSGLYMFIISFLHVLILRYCAHKLGNNLILFKLCRYFLGYSVGISLYLLSWYIAAPLAGLQRPDDTPGYGGRCNNHSFAEFDQE